MIMKKPTGMRRLGQKLPHSLSKVLLTQERGYAVGIPHEVGFQRW
jgi:hypothetical protein